MARAKRRLGGALAVGVASCCPGSRAWCERGRSRTTSGSAEADAFRAALRIPNVLQNLFGEGVLSASFIPVYARLQAEGKHADALARRSRGRHVARAGRERDRLAGSVRGALVESSRPDFRRRTRAHDQAVRILFPGVALLVLSAWCLGVLNSHRRFFLSYASPVLWNAALIAAAIVAGRRFADRDDIVCGSRGAP